MRVVGRGSAVDAPWPLAAQLVSAFRLRRTHAPAGSPLTIHDVRARADYRDLRTAKVEEGDLAPDFELPTRDGTGSVRLADLVAEQPVALVFGSYT